MPSDANAFAQPSAQSITLEDKRLLLTTLRYFESNSEQAAKTFYARLFELDPKTKDLFKGDIKEQGRKLMHMIATAVGSLDRLDELTPLLKLLGHAHRRAGVEKAHFATFKAALLSTLQDGLQDQFTPEIKDMWDRVLDLLSSLMNSPEH